MAFKSGWFKKIINGVSTKIFAISHVKTVYYNFDKKKTLAEKLDEMDKKIDSKSDILTKSNVTSALGYTPYTPNEIDNKFSTLETNIDWKESVATFSDIATTYPNPEDGWTVNVKDTDYTYRYNGSNWVAISANAIPKATDSVDGLMSKDDKTKLDGIATGANKTTVDSSLSTSSTNPVQNKVVTNKINSLCKILTSSATVATSAWTQGSTYYEAQIANSNITASVVVNGSVDLATKSIAENAGVINITESFAGYFKIYSKSVPSGSINISYTMLIPNK